MKKKIPPYNCILWDTNQRNIKFYDIMPYLVDCWEDEKKRKHKTWNRDFDNSDKEIDDTKMPETFEEFKRFVDKKSMYQFWSRCEYEVIVSAWPPHPKRDEDGNIKTYNYDIYNSEKRSIPTIDFYDEKLDVYRQIEANIDVLTKHFMSYVNS